MPLPGKQKIDLLELHKHLHDKPRTKSGQVRQAWPQIRDLLAQGHSLKDIRNWLDEAGIEIGYARLSDYVCQLKRRDMPNQSSSTVVPPSAAARSVRTDKPLTQFLEREKQSSGFVFDPDRKPEDLI